MTNLITIKQVKSYIKINFNDKQAKKNINALQFTPPALTNLTTEQILEYRGILYSQGYVFVKLFDTKEEKNLINLNLSHIVKCANEQPAFVDAKYSIVKKMREIASQIVENDFSKFNVFNVIAKNCPNQPYHVDEGVYLWGQLLME